MGGQEVQEVLVAAVQRFANPVPLRNNSYLARVQARALLPARLASACFCPSIHVFTVLVGYQEQLVLIGHQEQSNILARPLLRSRSDVHATYAG